jgi:hypothetical protein
MSNPFDKPTTPKNSFTLFYWLLFEPVLLRRYARTLFGKEARIIALKAILITFLVFVIPLTLLLYVVFVTVIAAFDLPLLFPPTEKWSLLSIEIRSPLFSKEKIDLFLQQWQTSQAMLDKISLFISFNQFYSLKLLAVGLAFGLAVGLAYGLAVGLAYGLAVGLAV